MLKKLLASGLMIAMSTTVAFAADAPYVGVGLGDNIAHWKINDSTGTKVNFGSQNVYTSLFAGYGTTYDSHFYLGGEVFGNLTSTASGTKTFNNGVSQASLKQTYSYGASVLPGYVFGNDNLVFVRAGLVRTRFIAKDTEGSNATVTTRNTKTGSQLGLGAQTSLTTDLDLRGEYDYTRYGSMKVFNTSFKPSSSQVSLALVYKFN